MFRGAENPLQRRKSPSALFQESGEEVAGRGITPDPFGFIFESATAVSFHLLRNEVVGGAPQLVELGRKLHAIRGIDQKAAKNNLPVSFLPAEARVLVRF